MESKRKGIGKRDRTDECQVKEINKWEEREKMMEEGIFDEKEWITNERTTGKPLRE